MEHGAGAGFAKQSDAEASGPWLYVGSGWGCSRSVVGMGMQSRASARGILRTCWSLLHRLADFASSPEAQPEPHSGSTPNAHTYLHRVLSTVNDIGGENGVALCRSLGESSSLEKLAVPGIRMPASIVVPSSASTSLTRAVVCAH